jgi:amino acid adenylation domain-containing protein
MEYLLHHLLERSARLAPDAEAFRYADDALTFAALNRRANGLAQLLLENGARPGDRVGLLLPKCLETAISVYGCLKAGLIYVPLDVKAPVGRTIGILEQAEIRHLITHPSASRQVTQLTETCTLQQVVGIDAPPEQNGTTIFRPFQNIEALEAGPELTLVEDDPAYLLYTSGSTGAPKGILHSHRSGLAYARLAAATYSVGPEDRLGNFAPLHFDQSTFEFFCGPMCGATVVLIPPVLPVTLATLADLIERERLTFFYSVPTIWVQLLNAGVVTSRDFSSLRWILFGGEPFPPRQLAMLRELLPCCRLANVYGPTETNQCTHYEVTGAGAEALPIGRPWPNTDILIQAPDGRPVGQGTAGELLVRSPTMMLGYWRRPDLDAEAFFHRRGPGGQPERFYRTGDQVLEKPNGELTFLGRLDRQIKSHGHRVELDEVEQHLLSHPDVLEGAVYPVRETDQGVMIAAAVIASEGFDDRALRAHLARLLPAYALPGRIEQVKALPRTRTGKIDRNALARGVEAPQSESS